MNDDAGALGDRTRQAARAQAGGRRFMGRRGSSIDEVRRMLHEALARDSHAPFMARRNGADNALSDPPDVISDFACYEDLTEHGALLCEEDFHEALARGRRRRAAREDFAAGWKEAARRFGLRDLFVRP